MIRSSLVESGPFGVSLGLPPVVGAPTAEWGTLTPQAFFPRAYRLMYAARKLDLQLFDLFKKGYVKGTVTCGLGNEATAVAMTLPLRAGRDVVSLLHRDIGGHLTLGANPRDLVSQYLANAESMTHGREGNCHHGDAAARRLPMISHLGNMLSLVVGGTWAARQRGEDAVGLAVVGDGGSSCGQFHESINLASVRRAPVLFLVQNNHYSFSTPTDAQYRCAHLADRAAGYGIPGATIDGTDAWEVYHRVCHALEIMRRQQTPFLLECLTLRLMGHAAYDRGDYVPPEQREAWARQDPLPKARLQLQKTAEWSVERITALERDVDEEIRAAVAAALPVPRPRVADQGPMVYLQRDPPAIAPTQGRNVKYGDAIRRGLERVLSEEPTAYLLGLDIGVYGSAFKTCKGLWERFGGQRVIDMPLCEAAIAGFALGASQVGLRPIIEFQFADFSTEAVTQIGLNTGTWYFRTGQAAPVLYRLPCGGGLTLGAFHSGEFEGLWSHFPGLKLLYPATAGEAYEAILAGFYDPNPCLVFEHKRLYWSSTGDIDFDGNLGNVWRPRRYTTGDDLTLVAFGAAVPESLAAAAASGRAIEVWNPFVLGPWNLEPIAESIARTGRLLVVQECGPAQGLGERMIGQLVRSCQPTCWKAAPQLLATPNRPVPFAAELENDTLPNAASIRAAIDTLLGAG